MSPDAAEAAREVAKATERTLKRLARRFAGTLRPRAAANDSPPPLDSAAIAALRAAEAQERSEAAKLLARGGRALRTARTLDLARIAKPDALPRLQELLR